VNLNNYNKFFFLICLVLLFANTALLSQTWETYTNKDDVQDLCCAGDYCWAATTGGVVKVNIHDFSFEEFDQDDWLPLNNVNTIFNYNEQIWLGYYGNGITIYDGIKEFFYNSNNSGLVNNIITCFAIDTLNRIWIGTKGGVSVFDGKIWEKYNTDNSDIIDDDIHSIAVDKNNKIWIGTIDGISVFDGGNWQTFFANVDNERIKMFLGKLAVDFDNNIWTTGGGLYNNKTNEWSNYKDSTSFITDKSFNMIYVNQKNVKLFGTNRGRVYCYNDTIWSVFDSTNSILPVDYKNSHGNIIASPVNAISEDKNGNMWFGTKRGLYFYNGTDWKKVTISRTLPSNWITAIAVDWKNHKWYGTVNKGVSVDKNGEWQTFNTLNSNMQSGVINAIAADSSDNVWIATGNKGAAIYDGDSLRDVKNSGGKPPMYTILSITVDRDGTVWMGGLSKLGVVEYRDNSFISHFDPDKNEYSTIIGDVGIDMYNNKWLCFYERDYWNFTDPYGVCRYNGSDWQFFNTGNSGIASNDVEAVAVEDNGLIWFGTTNGVSTFDGENWQTYNSDNSGLIHNYITAITIDKKGRKWFGTYGGGLFMYDGEIWHIFTTTNSKLCNNYIQALETDKEGNILIGTWFGLSIYKETETGITHQTETEKPDKIELLQNYPNPFNSNTKIHYKLTDNGYVKIQIFNIYGQHVKTLYDKKQNPGIHSSKWNGQNENGETVSSGVYFCRLALDEQNVETIRLVFLK